VKTMDSYDLLRKEDWKAESTLVITPYVTEEFFDRLLKIVRPKKLFILVDDGCRDEDLEMLNSLKDKRRGLKTYIAQGAAQGGLVHAKVFHTIWLNKTATQRRETIVIGSGNATGPAFGEKGNAEIFARVDISKSPDAPDLKTKFVEMRGAIEAAQKGSQARTVDAEAELRIADGIVLRWPKIKVKPSRNIPDSFDAWLQRGWLLSSYLPDVDFLKVAVKLKKALPPSAIEASVNRADWETNKSQVIRHTYLGVDAEPNDTAQDDKVKLDAENWRAKYFVQTHLGYWCSDACYHEKKDEFVKARKDNRAACLRQLSELKDIGPLARERGRFIMKLRDLWVALGFDASGYLNAKGDSLDERHYCELFDKKIKQDLKKLKSEEFCDRFKSGVQITRVPKFRDDKEGWDSFLGSFENQLMFENGKERSQNLVFQRVKICVELEAGEIYLKLQSRWQKNVKGKACSTKQFIDNYYELIDVDA
jgi:hypothetical protein